MFKTSQEKFWAGDFGKNYIGRNNSRELLASNLNFFSQSLKCANNIKTCIEFGSNIGMNLKALKLLYPSLDMSAVEINKTAIIKLSKIVNKKNIFSGSILDYVNDKKFDLVFVKGLLIHIDPKKLNEVYKKLFYYTKKYLLVAEYYSPNPQKLNYRGFKNKLFKRDFVGDIIKLYPELKLIDYGFNYHKDKSFPMDDINWFLLEK